MTLGVIIMERATSAGELQNLIGARIARSSGLSSWALPYVIFTVSGIRPEFTMRPGADLSKALVETYLYARSGGELDELEAAWHMRFNKKKWTPSGSSGPINSWITSVYDEPVQSLQTDTKARAHLRIIETEFAFIPS